MSARRWSGLAAAAAIALGACAKAPPPPAKAPVVEAPPPAPPPPPPCEALDEACEGDGAKRARVAGTELLLTPPRGWVYAQEPEAFVATASAAALAAAGYDVPEAGPKKGAAEKAATKAREVAFAALAKRLELTWKRPPSFPKKPQKTLTVAGKEVHLFQFDGATRGGKKGPVLAFQAKLDATHAVVGAGFVAEDDDANADQAILGAVESLAPAPSDAAEP